MEVVGKIIVALPEVGGTSRQGNQWRKREYVLETLETYPRKVFFNFFGDRIDQYPLQLGQVYKVSFDIDSREFNGRWFVDIRAWKAEDPNSAPGAAQPQPYGAQPQQFGAQPQSFGPATQMPQGYGAPAAAPEPPAPDLTPSATDDLPF